MDDKTKKDFEYQRLTPALIEQRKREVLDPAPLVPIDVPKKSEPSLISKIPAYLLKFGRSIGGKVNKTAGFAIGLITTPIANYLGVDQEDPLKKQDGKTETTGDLFKRLIDLIIQLFKSLTSKKK